MRGVVRAMAGGHMHIIIKKEEALIVTTAAFSKATKCPAGLCASGELCVQYRRFLNSPSYNPCPWLAVRFMATIPERSTPLNIQRQ